MAVVVGMDEESDATLAYTVYHTDTPYNPELLRSCADILLQHADRIESVADPDQVQIILPPLNT